MQRCAGQVQVAGAGRDEVTSEGLRPKYSSTEQYGAQYTVPYVVVHSELEIWRRGIKYRVREVLCHEWPNIKSLATWKPLSSARVELGVQRPKSKATGNQNRKASVCLLSLVRSGS